MADSVPLQIAETIQTASINRAPSPTHDLNPSTTVSSKEPVHVSHTDPTDSHSIDSELYSEDEELIDADEYDIPYSVIRPLPRKHALPPLPDLRFEQSYLASISKAETKGRIAWITIRDQVFSHLISII
jgi:hypothetical protein